MGSITILKALSNIVGISLASSGLESSRQGFVFTSIRYTLKSSDIIKSSPNTSKVFMRLRGSILLQVARMQSAVNCLNYGRKSRSTEMDLS